MMKAASILMGLAVLGLVVGTAEAALVAGGSFESPDIADGTDDVIDATGQTWSDGWSSYDNNKSVAYGAGREDPSTDKTGQTGDQYAKMVFAYTTSLDQWVKIESPSLGTAAAGYTYTFKVDMSWDSQYASGTQPGLTTIYGTSDKWALYINDQEFVRNHPSLTKNTFSETSIEVVLDASGNLLSTDADSAPSVGTALAGGDIYALLTAGRLRSTGGNGSTYMLWDNARFDAVPEPAALGLLAVGGVGMLLRRRRR